MSHRLRPALLSVVFCVALPSAHPLSAQTDPAQGDDALLATLLQGIEARHVTEALSGRVLIAYRTAAAYGEGKRMWDPADPGATAEGDLLDVMLTDFAMDGRSWRQETRVVVSSGLDWAGCAGLGTHPQRPLRVDDLYHLSACDGEVVHIYDRTLRQVQVVAYPGSQYERRIPTLTMLESLVDTAPGYLVPLFRRELRAKVAGVEKMDGVQCHVLVGVGNQDHPKGYFRAWVAPDRDCAVLRLEHVETNAKGRPTSCQVIRSLDWTQDEAFGLWLPGRVQWDTFEYREGALKGWSYSHVMRPLRLNPMVEEPSWLPLLPFDTQVYDDRTKDVQPDPTADLEALLQLVHFEAPDAFGEAMQDADPDLAF